MPEYYLSKKAILDLKDIWNYTCEKWSENQADKYYQMMIDSFGEVSRNPKMGKDYSIIMDNLKGHKAGRHIVFYLEKEEGRVEIIRVLYERMD